MTWTDNPKRENMGKVVTDPAVDVGAGIWAAPRITYTGEPDPALPAYIESAEIEYSESKGRYLLVSVRLTRSSRGGRVNTESMNMLSMPDLIASVRSEALKGVETADGITPFSVVAPGANTKSLGHHLNVRRLYGIAHMFGDGAAKLTANHYGVTRRTVHHWLRRASDLGLDRPVADWPSELRAEVLGELAERESRQDEIWDAALGLGGATFDQARRSNKRV